MTTAVALISRLPFALLSTCCRAVSYQIDRVPDPAERRSPKGVLTLTGEPVLPTDPIRCASCRRPFSPRHWLVVAVVEAV